MKKDQESSKGSGSSIPAETPSKGSALAVTGVPTGGLSTRSHAEEWILDSEASHHMTTTRQLFTDYSSLKRKMDIHVASGITLSAVGKGDVEMTAVVGGQPETITLSGVLHIPGLSYNLLSLPQAACRGASIDIGPTRTLIKKDGVVIADAPYAEGLYRLRAGHALCVGLTASAEPLARALRPPWLSEPGQASAGRSDRRRQRDCGSIRACR